MKLSWDMRADALYVRCSAKPWAYTRSLDDARHLDYARDGTVIGVEVLYPTSGITMDGLPEDVAQFLTEWQRETLADA